MIYSQYTCISNKALTRRVSPVEQELPTLAEYLSSPPVFSGIRVAWILVLIYRFNKRIKLFVCKWKKILDNTPFGNILRYTDNPICLRHLPSTQPIQTCLIHIAAILWCLAHAQWNSFISGIKLSILSGVPEFTSGF
jgi:hypothetical protein